MLKLQDRVDQVKRLLKVRVVNFMVVGGLGYILNMAIYYPLTLVFKTQVEMLGQNFYLPPFLISTYIAITFCYFMNRAWTFRNDQELNQGYLKYVMTNSATLVGDIFLLWILVNFGHLVPELAAALAILATFVIRYTVLRRWVWKMKSG